MFFNLAAFHAAGDNRTEDIHRLANLQQLGCSYGRSIEIVDRTRMNKTLYPHLLTLKSTSAAISSTLPLLQPIASQPLPLLSIEGLDGERA